METTIKTVKKNDCCGCSACMAVCPVNAIEMKPDEQGFLYPAVNGEVCINCGACLAVCRDRRREDSAPVRAYAAITNDCKALTLSSSGGISHALCERMIQYGGVVYGVGYDNAHRVVYARAETMPECDAFYGAKYVQSDPVGSMRTIIEDLRRGKNVLYIGTSCYVAGLYALCDKKGVVTDKLITVDLICHGVPSPLLFADYISLLKKKKEFERFAFRTKKVPWGNGSRSFACTIFYGNGKEETDTLKARLYLNLFFSNNCLRPCCYQCEYAGAEKPADITIADYWGLKSAHPDFFNEFGVSAVMTHGEKGDSFFKECDLNRINSTVEKIAFKQGNLKEPSKKSKDYQQFWELYHRRGFMAVAKKYGGLSIYHRAKRTAKHILNLTNLKENEKVYYHH